MSNHDSALPSLTASLLALLFFLTVFGDGRLHGSGDKDQNNPAHVTEPEEKSWAADKALIASWTEYYLHSHVAGKQTNENETVASNNQSNQN